MSDEYKNGNEEMFGDEPEFIRDEVLVEKFRLALKYRLEATADATAAASNYQEVARSLDDIAQDEALVSALDDEARRRIGRAEERRTVARTSFNDRLGQLSATSRAVAQGQRFAVQVAVREETRVMQKLDAAEGALAKAQEDRDNAKAELELWHGVHEEARALPTRRQADTSKDLSRLPSDVQDRLAHDALVQYKEALSQHRSELANAKYDYATRLQALRTLQTTHLSRAIDALTTAKALPDANAATYGTKVVLRSVG